MKKKLKAYLTIDQVAERLAAWFETWEPELLQLKLEKDNAAALEKQALRSTHAGYTRLDLLFAVCLIVLYVIAGSAAPTVLTEAGTAAAGSNYHGF